MLNIKRLYHLLFVLYPILSGYGFSVQLDYGSILLFLCGLMYCITKRKSVKLVSFRGYNLFLIVAVLFSILFLKSVPVRLILFSINLYFALALIDVEKLIKYYGCLIAVCCCYFVLQEFSYQLTGSRISGLTTLVPTIYGPISAKYVATQMVVPRSATFFLEPSYFAQFLFPYIVIQLFSGSKSGIKKAVIVSVVMFLVKSGNGTILLMLIWGIWIFLSSFKLVDKILVTFFLILGVVGLYAVDTTIFEDLMSRKSEIASVSNTYAGDGETSGFIRFFRGYYLYADLPLVNKLFGSSKDLVNAVMSQSTYLWNRDRFLNGTQTLLIYSGVIVCLLYFRYVLLLLKGVLNRKQVVVLVVGFVFLMFSESYYLCSRSMLTLVIICGFIRDKLEENNRSFFRVKIKFKG